MVRLKQSLSHSVAEKKHFYLQLIRIIKNSPEFNLVKLCQIAYNIGQLSVYIDSDKVYDGNPRDFYYINNLNQINSYVDVKLCSIDSNKLENLIKKINEKLKELKKQSGGSFNYYNKYLKYKQKYLQLKNN
jgi:hypothetical protein